MTALSLYIFIFSQDCHVLTFSSTGSVSDHLVLHPQLATGNFIIKAIWLPGSQTELAIITADFVKVCVERFCIFMPSNLEEEKLLTQLSFVSLAKQIYDLSVDALSPMYYFLLPSSKIRDATFLFNEEGKNIIVIMSSAGYMYTQIMDESSSAQHGPFYVTNVLEINHEDLKVMAFIFKQQNAASELWYCAESSKNVIVPISVALHCYFYFIDFMFVHHFKLMCWVFKMQKVTLRCILFV